MKRQAKIKPFSKLLRQFSNGNTITCVKNITKYGIIKPSFFNNGYKLASISEQCMKKARNLNVATRENQELKTGYFVKSKLMGSKQNSIVFS